MKMFHHYFSSMALGVCLGLTSMFFLACQDTDVEGAGGSGSEGTSEVTDAEWQRERQMAALVGALADRDSLPAGWQDSTFEATLGEGLSEAEGQVRLVSSSSSEDAYRFFKSVTLSAYEAGVVPQSEEWVLSGVGSLRFVRRDEASVFATIEVNLPQMPTLQEIRFVPSSALGNNAVVNTFYSLGDVIRQDINGTGDYTYWVCVRPCSSDGNYKKSHWCSFQLNAENAGNANFKTFTEKGCAPITLPTDLSSNEADGERMLQNYFNTLRVMADPTLFTDNSQIDAIDILTSNMVRNSSYMWDDKGVWEKVLPPDNTVLRGSVVEDKAMFRAFHMGYSKTRHLLGKNDYKVYYVTLRNNPSLTKNSTLFNASVAGVCSVTTDEKKRDFSTLNASGYMGFSLNTDLGLSSGVKNTYVVKYRTGAQLEGRWSAYDKDPSNSFESRKQSNRIEDVFVYKNIINTNLLTLSYNVKEAKIYVPFFAFGDRVRASVEYDRNSYVRDSLFCLRESTARSRSEFQSLNADNLKAYFLAANDQKSKGRVGVAVPDTTALYLSTLLLDAYTEENERLIHLDSNSDNAAYLDGLEELKNFMNKYGINNKFTVRNTKYLGEDGTNTYLFKANFRILPIGATNQSEAVLKSVTIKYMPNAKGQKLFYKIEDADVGEDFVLIESYADTMPYNDTFSSRRTLHSTGQTRRDLKGLIREAYKAYNIQELEED